MPGQPRSLPARPSLRYLKLEAKRRLADGEFASLHDAQVAVAREHGRPSWAALKQAVDGAAGPDSHALDQLRWVLDRFGRADQPGWAPPADDELRQRFDARLLAAVQAETLVGSLAGAAAALRATLEVTGLTPLSVRAEVGGLEIFATVEDAPPYRLTGLRGLPLGSRVSDPRTTTPPPNRTSGAAPGWAAELAASAFDELGLAALILAGSGDGAADGSWVVARGWADLVAGEVLDTGHRLPASGISALVTATAVLRLVADGRVGLDAPANDHLRAVRLADGAVTVRDLLGHTGGVDSPPPGEMTAGTVPELVTVTGPVIGCGGPRGVVRPSNGGTAALGQLVADVTAAPFPVAATELVLAPLRMTSASYPTSVADLGPRAAVPYDVTPEGTFAPAPAAVCTLPAAGGLWATAADLVRLGTGWSSLLPPPLAREALPTDNGAPRGGGATGVGLGWFLSPRGDLAMAGGALPGSTASLLLRVGDGRVHLAVTTRNVALDRIGDRVLRAWAER